MHATDQQPSDGNGNHGPITNPKGLSSRHQSTKPIGLIETIQSREKLMNQSSLVYRIASAIELITGVSLLVLPNLGMQFLFKTPPSAAGEQLTQLYGLALIGLGVSCWGNPCPKPAQRGLLVYNGAATILLLALALHELSGGAAVWLGTGIHLILSVWMIRDQILSSSR